jgi:transposase
VWTGEGRKADTLREFFNGMPEEVRQGIEAVAIDMFRREEIAKAKKEDKPVISGSRWILLKNRDNLKDSELPRLEELLAVNENLAKVYILKDDLKVIWKYDERELMAQALTDWCTRAIEAELPSLNRFVRLIERHWEGILNHACHPISNGRLEGTNNKIKVIKRESYGFHDLEYFQLKIKQRCSGKQEKGQHLRR